MYMRMTISSVLQQVIVLMYDTDNAMCQSTHFYKQKQIPSHMVCLYVFWHFTS